MAENAVGKELSDSGRNSGEEVASERAFKGSKRESERAARICRVRRENDVQDARGGV